MKKSLKYSVIVSSLLVLNGCCSLGGSGGKVLDMGDTIEVSNVKYRTGNASKAELGSVGYVSGLGMGNGKNTFKHQRTPEYNDLKLSNDGVITQDFTKTASTEYKIEIESTIAKLVDAKAYSNGKTATNIEKEVSYHLLSVKNADDIVVHLNNSLDKRPMALMKAGGTTSRFIPQVIVAFGYKASTVLQSSGKTGLLLKTTGSDSTLVVGDISIAKAKIDAELGYSNDISNKISLSDGMIVGYTYDIACWVKDSHSGDTVILTSVLDKYGKSQTCTNGVKDPSKVK